MRGKRVCVVVLGGVLLALPAILLYQNGPGSPGLPDCLFHDLTGFNCPGCGMTRATHAVLHGHPLAALRFNFLAMTLMPVLLFGLVLELIGWMRDKPLPVNLRFGRGVMWRWIGVVVACWVLRNIPVWPLTLLAPP